MSNAYSITELDIRKSLIEATTFDSLALDPTTGVALTTEEKQAVCDQAIQEFASWLTGTFATVANLALAKPQALKFVVYAFHFRRAANGDYKIPESVKDDYKLAVEWAKGTGAKLLAAEGTVQVPGAGAVEYAADEARHSMSQLDRL
jgi:hypothetical protein